MAENTKIEWAHHTFNPWEGCQKVGPGCDHCYAETRNARFGGGQAVNWGPGAPRRRTTEANWRQPLKWNAQAEREGRRYRVFCASLADVFDNEVPAEWRADLLHLIVDTPHLDWLLLTKRIGNAHAMLQEAAARNCMPRWGEAMFSNVWIGATVVNQAEADRDIPKLLKVPARVRFLSIEPMLGPISLRWLPAFVENAPYIAQKSGGPGTVTDHLDGLRRLDWIIVGGESGPHARPMHPDWARSLRDQCAAAGVPFLFKQWGEWTPGENVERVRGTVDTAFLWDDGWRIYPLNLATDHGHIDDQPDLYRVGKKAAGRLLDGVEHNGFPEVTRD